MECRSTSKTVSKSPSQELTRQRVRVSWSILVFVILCWFVRTSEDRAIGQSADGAPTTYVVGELKSWFFSSIVPYKWDDAPYLALSLSLDSLERNANEENPPHLRSPVWLTFWKGGSSRVGALRMGDYDFARDIPFSVTTKEDLYLFYFRNKSSIQHDAPVVRRTPGGWAWQPLETVEWPVRQLVRIADFSEGKIFDGTGALVMDIPDLEPILPHPENLVDLGCRVDAGNAKGLVGRPATTISQQPFDSLGSSTGQSDLPYRDIYFYHVSLSQKPFFARLSTVTAVANTTVGLSSPVPTVPHSAEIAGNNSVSKLTETAADVTSGDQVTFGNPILDVHHADRVFYWYCIQHKTEPTRKIFILACFHNDKVDAVDGYITQSSKVTRVWSGKIWTPTNIDQYWIYGSALHVSVQPLVGVDADGNVLVYRASQLVRIVDAPSKASGV